MINKQYTSIITDCDLEVVINVAFKYLFSCQIIGGVLLNLLEATYSLSLFI